jgi:hypothetical protein
VSFYDVLLALHVFGAFALVGAITLFSIVIVATWRAKRPSDVVGFAASGASASCSWLPAS